MEMIKRVPSILIGGVKYSAGLFKCPNCGSEKIRRVTEGRKVKTCQCYKHGEKKTKLYSVWSGMRRRCNIKSSDNWKYYGAKGIKVCEEWKIFLNFKKWALENGWAPHLQIDRIDNDGDYRPGNCQLLTPAQNSRKRPSTKLSLSKAMLIRSIYSFGVISQSKLGRLFNSDQPTVWLIVHNKIWKP